MRAKKCSCGKGDMKTCGCRHDKGIPVEKISSLIKEALSPEVEARAAGKMGITPEQLRTRATLNVFGNRRLEEIHDNMSRAERGDLSLSNERRGRMLDVLSGGAPMDAAAYENYWASRARRRAIGDTRRAMNGNPNARARLPDSGRRALSAMYHARDPRLLVPAALALAGTGYGAYRMLGGGDDAEPKTAMDKLALSPALKARAAGKMGITADQLQSQAASNVLHNQNLGLHHRMTGVGTGDMAPVQARNERLLQRATAAPMDDAAKANYGASRDTRQMLGGVRRTVGNVKGMIANRDPRLMIPAGGLALAGLGYGAYRMFGGGNDQQQPPVQKAAGFSEIDRLRDKLAWAPLAAGVARGAAMLAPRLMSAGRAAAPMARKAAPFAKDMAKDMAIQTGAGMLMQPSQSQSQETKSAGWFGFGSKKEKPAPRPMQPANQELTPEQIAHIHALADKYMLDRGYAIKMHGPWHSEFPDATEHNIAAESDAQLQYGGKGVPWDAQRWGKPNPLG